MAKLVSYSCGGIRFKNMPVSLWARKKDRVKLLTRMQTGKRHIKRNRYELVKCRREFRMYLPSVMATRRNDKDGIYMYR